MASLVPDDMTIRDYLLGRLDPASDTVERVDELVLTNSEFLENVAIIEDEIIEEYLEGTLNDADRQSVETHFLRPPERQRKLQHARLLSTRLALANAAVSPDRDNLLQIQPTPPPVAHLGPRVNFRFHAAIAAAILLAVSVLYLSQSRRQIQSALGESAQRLAQEREHSAQLSKQLQTARDIAQPSTAMLNLFQSGILRGSGESLPRVTIGPGSSKVRVELALGSPDPRAYNLRLEAAGKPLWSLGHLTPFTSRDGAVLIFEIPASVLTSGENRLEVFQTPELPTIYSFIVYRP